MYNCSAEYETGLTLDFIFCELKGCVFRVVEITLLKREREFVHICICMYMYVEKYMYPKIC